MKEILDKISDFCVSTFTVHASQARVRGGEFLFGVLQHGNTVLTRMGMYD